MSIQHQPAAATEKSARVAPTNVVRAYRPEDEPRVLELLRLSLERWAACPDRSALWRWKHQGNPFGPSSILVHETPEREIVGVVALMFWRLRQGDRTILCERTTELATHPEHRRRGVASSFHGPGRQIVIDAGVSLVFHNPNRRSLGFTLRTDRPIFEMRPRFGVRRAARLPLAFVPAGNGRPAGDRREPAGAFRREPLPVATLLEREAALADLLAHDAARRGARLQTERTLEYLRWRYAAHPTIRYYAACAGSGDRLDGSVIFRVDRYRSARRLVLQEVLSRAPVEPVARALRRELDALVDCDLVQYFDSEAGWDALLPGCTLPTWNAYRFTVGLYGEAQGRSPLELGSWSLTLGDLQEI